MGFLINIKYHPKKEGGGFGFNTEKPENKTIKVGKKEEEISYLKLASVILKQLSRRDILVYEIEATEFVKKTIKVRETANGIVIGNKKYIFDDAIDISNITVVDENSSNKPSPKKPQTPPVVKKEPQLKVLKIEYFNPEPGQARILINEYNRMGLTIGKGYKVVKEDGLKYTIINNQNNKISVPLDNFSAVPPGGRLENEFTSEDPNEPSLMFDDELSNSPSPKLR